MIIKAYKQDKEIKLDLLGTVGYCNAEVVYKCDSCGSENKTTYYALKRKDRLNKQYCRSCTIKLNNVVNKRKSTCIEKYNVDNPMKVKKFKEKFIDNLDYEKQRIGIETVKKQFNKEGYILLTDKYKNRMQRLEYICPVGHRGNITYSSWNRGSRCRTCAYISNAESKKYTLDEVRNILNKEGYELLSESYKNKYIPIKYKCPKGHIGYVSFGNWLSNNTRCSSCSHIISNQEIEVFNFIKSYFKDAEHNDRELIKPFEVDILIPSKKIVIEYCGLYWHSELNGKDKWYHLNKLKRCNDVGYDLITIFEDEWLNRRDIVISRLKYILGISKSEKIYARECVIREIDSKAKNVFLEKFHLQGKDYSRVKLGAFHNNRLVSVMTFSKGNISKGSKNIKGVYELNRFCSDYNYIIVGIASKLLKHFIKNYDECDSIFSYADRRWSVGSLYETLGFKLESYSEPNYWYIVDRRRVHRFNFRKNSLAGKLEKFDDSKSGWENMKDNNYDRIFDCGNIKFNLKVVNKKHYDII